MKMMTIHLMKLCLLEYVLDELNMMYPQCVQKAVKKRSQHVLNLDEKEYVSRYTRICLREVAYARGKERSKSRMGKRALKVQNQG